MGQWQARTPLEQGKRLNWSVSALRAQLKIKADDPALTTGLAEALSKQDSGRDEARALLESLAARDLVVTPQGYEALAELRRERGDEAGEQLAMKRCESMATGRQACEPSRPRASWAQRGPTHAPLDLALLDRDSFCGRRMVTGTASNETGHTRAELCSRPR